MNETSALSRRSMLLLAGALGASAGAGAVLGGCSSEQPAQDSQEPSSSVEFNVYDPTGSIQVTQLFSPRLDSLEGKTIAFVSDDAWEDDRTFALIKQLFEERYPSVTIITQDNFISGIAAITAANNGIADKMLEMGVDAAIVGNAG